MEEIVDLSKMGIDGFDWDEGNKEKNWLKHKVTVNDAEQVFLNEPLIIIPDIKHSGIEKRFVAHGKTNNNRKLTVIFTFRSNKIRVISARNQNKKERRKYEKTSQINTKV